MLKMPSSKFGRATCTNSFGGKLKSFFLFVATYMLLQRLPSLSPFSSSKALDILLENSSTSIFRLSNASYLKSFPNLIMASGRVIKFAPSIPSADDIAYPIIKDN